MGPSARGSGLVLFTMINPDLGCAEHHTKNSMLTLPVQACIFTPLLVLRSFPHMFSNLLGEFLFHRFPLQVLSVEHLRGVWAPEMSPPFSAARPPYGDPMSGRLLSLPGLLLSRLAALGVPGRRRRVGRFSWGWRLSSSFLPWAGDREGSMRDKNIIIACCMMSAQQNWCHR